MSYCYKVANLYFSLHFADPADPLKERLSNYAPFLVDATGVQNVEHYLFRLEVSPYKDGKNIEKILEDIRGQKPLIEFDEEDKILRFFKTQDGYDLHFVTKVSKKDNLGILRISNKYTRGELFTKGTDFARKFFLDNSLMFLFALAGSNKQVLLQHASVIKKDGYAFLFLGKSGTGKSTHSVQWLNSIDGTELLNDDNPAIRIDNSGQLFAFGTPWSGKTPCYKNDYARVGAFVRIVQAPHNKIVRLGKIPAYVTLFPTFSNLKWEPYISDGVNDTINKIIMQSSVYELECLPNTDAAKVCYDAVTKDLKG